MVKNGGKQHAIYDSDGCSQIEQEGDEQEDRFCVLLGLLWLAFHRINKTLQASLPPDMRYTYVPS